MSLTPYRTLRLFENSLFRDPFFREFFREAERSTAEAADTVLVPRMNVVETDNGYDLTFDVAGIPQEDIKIEVEGGRLAVWGERKVSREDTSKDRKWHLREISYGSFRREVALPDDVDNAGIEARYDKGLLHVTVPKAVQKKPRAIEIRA